MNHSEQTAATTAGASPDPDVTCLHCGYNLRGLAPTGLCPECGDPIHLSIRGDLLSYANFKWLRKIQLGINLAYYSVTLSIVAAIVFTPAMALAGAMPLWGLTILARLFGFVIVGGLLALFGAMFMVTIQEPRISLTEGAVTWRRVIRACVIAILVIVVVTTAPVIDSMTGAVLDFLMSLLQLLLVMVIIFGYFAHVKAFAFRIPDTQLVKSTRIVQWGFLILITISGLGWAASVVPQLRPNASAAMPKAVSAALSAFSDYDWLLYLSYFVFVMWAQKVLLRYRQAFTVAIQEAGRADAAIDEKSESDAR